MADENNLDMNNPDILQQLVQQNSTDTQILKSIDTSLKQILGDANKISASNARNMGISDIFSARNTPFSTRRFNNGKGAIGNFTDELGSAFVKELVGPEFHEGLKNIRENLVRDFGVAFEDIPGKLGQQAGKKLVEEFASSKMGAELQKALQGKLNNSLDKFKSGYTKKMQSATEGKYKFDENLGKAIQGVGQNSEAIQSLSETATATTDALQGVEASATNMSNATAIAAEGTQGLESVLGGLTGTLGELGPLIALAVVGFKFQMALTKPLRDFGKWVTGPTLNGIKKTVTALGQSLSRHSNSYTEALKASQTRIEADYEYMVKRPFEILNQAAEEWYQAWDNNLKTITTTQGYSKADVQDLAIAFSERLTKEGLSSVISSTDIMNNLSKVISAGLSGTAAEEFAYLATVLNEVVPTQDFFSYAADYASIAANAVNQGKSQTEALKIANEQLTEFANSILTAKNATGGLTTGLQDAESLFKQSVQIAQTAKTNSSGTIGSMMATIAAVTGAIAPDLASSMTEAVYNAAVGGNSSSIVALRSLAGINASNTEFLLELSKNPQKVFGAMFSKLAEMQNMSPGAFMEVAEGLSETFGLSASAFARVDFNALAEAINNYDSNSAALDDIVKLVKDGQTTTSTAQLKMQQINKMILDEGLSYVLDTEEGRIIQQHMWQEQQTQAITEATYGVNIVGAVKETIMGIEETLYRIWLVMTGNWAKAIAYNVAESAMEAKAQHDDITQMLELTKVGAGNSEKLYQLTHTGYDYDVVDNLVDMLGGHSTYKSIQDAAARAGYGNSTSFQLGTSTKAIWNSVSKSGAASLFSNYVSPASFIGSTISAAGEVVNDVQSKLKSKISSMLNGIVDFAEKGGSFTEFLATAKDYGISSFTDAMESVGYSSEKLESQYNDIMNQLAINKQVERNKKEETFWDSTTNYLDKISSSVSKYLEEWEDYYISHTVYNNAYTRDSVDRIMREERENSESAIYALADALTENNVDLLVDPTLQTNALLSQILKVANAILNQQSTGTNGVSLPDTIAGLSLGLINM